MCNNKLARTESRHLFVFYRKFQRTAMARNQTEDTVFLCFLMCLGLLLFVVIMITEYCKRNGNCPSIPFCKQQEGCEDREAETDDAYDYTESNIAYARENDLRVYTLWQTIHHRRRTRASMFLATACPHVVTQFHTSTCLCGQCVAPPTLKSV